MPKASQEEIYGQARTIFETVRLIKARTIAQYMTYAASRPPDHECDIDLTEPQVHMLMVVRDHGPITIKELARRLRVSAPSASAMVDRLVELGAVSREQSQVDRRQVVIMITPPALRLVEDIENHMMASVVDLLERLGPEYACKWSDVYARLGALLTEEMDHEISGSENGSEVA